MLAHLKQSILKFCVAMGIISISSQCLGMIVHGDLSINDSTMSGTERKVYASGARYRVTVTLDVGNYIYKGVGVSVDKAEGFVVEDGSDYYDLTDGKFYRKRIWQTPVEPPGTICTIKLEGDRIKKGPGGGGGEPVWEHFTSTREAELLSPIISIYKPDYSQEIALEPGGNVIIYVKAVADEGKIIENPVPIKFNAKDQGPTNEGTDHHFTPNPTYTDPATGCGTTTFYVSTSAGDDYRAVAWYEKADEPANPDTSQQSGYIFSVSIEIDAETEEDGARTDELQVQRVNTSSFVWEAIDFKVVYDLLPASGWTADTVTLSILDSDDTVVYTKNLSTSPGNNKETTWDGKDDATGELVPYGNYKAKIKVKKANPDDVAEDLEVESSLYAFTVYQVNQGNTVYHDIYGGAAKHGGIIGRYEGGNTLSDLNNWNKYWIWEIRGGGTVVGESRTLQGFHNYSPVIGIYTSPYLPTGVSQQRQERAQIIENTKAQFGLPYVPELPNPEFFNILIPYGSWGGVIPDIQKIRCDGVCEVAYENSADRLFCTDTNWNVMLSQDYLDYHNGSSGCTPEKQRQVSTSSPLHSP